MVGHQRLGEELLGERQGPAGVARQERVRCVGRARSEVVGHGASICREGAESVLREYGPNMVKLPIPEKPSEALRSAIERTFDATAGSAASTRDHAVELLDEVAKRGREVRSQLGRLESSVRGKGKG
jgi:hypothetical protein